jgi:hypothetical protein
MAFLLLLWPGVKPKPPPPVVKAGYRSLVGRWVGGLGASIPPVVLAGPHVSTTLTNKKSGPPSRVFTRREKSAVLFGIYQDAQKARKRLEGLSELELTEIKLKDAKAVQLSILNKFKVSSGLQLYEAMEDADAKVNELQRKVDSLRALEDARAKLKKQVADAIAKIRGH